jgi:hypothetical protein
MKPIPCETSRPAVHVGKLAVLALGLLVLIPARAATVQVLVRERGGGPVSEQPVVLQPVEPPGAVPTFFRRRVSTQVTAEDGKAVFESVPIGRYTVSLGRLADPGLIRPEANPLAPPPQITLVAEGDKASVEVEVWRGSLLVAEVLVDRANLPRSAKVILRSLDGLPGMDLPLDVQGRVERLLPPGRWEAELVIPPGYLLVDLVWNGESLPGHVARFDVREDMRKQNLSFFLSTPSLVTGKVTDESGGCPVRIVATLEVPGPWIAAATQRGGSSFQVVPHQEWVPNEICVYRLWLPDGTWSVAPQGDSLVTSEPATAEVAIGPGETRNLDFQLTTRDKDGPGKTRPLVVSVRSPEGLRLIGATVEVWPPGEEKPASGPLKSGTTERLFGAASFRGLAAGSYRIAAGSADFLEATAMVEAYDPKAKEGTGVSVTLRDGAKLHALALDEKDRPVQGVELRYERLAPLPETALADEGVAAKKRLGTALSDATGHALVSGLYSGDYRVEARMTGEQSATRFVLARQGNAKPSHSIEVRLTEGERSDVDLRVLPAASLSGGLSCSDRGTMPPKVSYRIFPAGSPVEGLWREKSLEKGAVMAPDGVLLRGEAADRFLLGPLPRGEYVLAARPDGQSYWSWASNELAPDRATVFPVAELASQDAGLVEIECGPLIAVVPEVLSKEALPDLRAGSVRATLHTAREEGRKRTVSPDVEVHAERAFLRRLPEGKFRAAVSLEHPYLIPPVISVSEKELDLTRGSLAEIHLTFDRVGGLVEVRGDGVAARLTRDQDRAVVRQFVGGVARFPGTPPGTYRVEMCGTPDCSAVTRAWDQVAVVAGKTTFLP